MTLTTKFCLFTINCIFYICKFKGSESEPVEGSSAPKRPSRRKTVDGPRLSSEEVQRVTSAEVYENRLVRILEKKNKDQEEIVEGLKRDHEEALKERDEKYYYY